MIDRNSGTTITSTTGWRGYDRDSTAGYDYCDYGNVGYITSTVSEYETEFDYWYEGQGFKNAKDYGNFLSAISSREAIEILKHTYENNYDKIVVLNNYDSRSRKIIPFDYHNKRRMALQRLYAA